MRERADRLLITRQLLADKRTEGIARLIARMQDLPRGHKGALEVVLFLAAAWGDYATGADAAFTLLYLLPIMLASWCRSMREGVFFSILSALSLLVIDILTRRYVLHPVLLGWNFLAELSVFLLATYLLAALRDLLLHEQHTALSDPLTGIANRRHFVEHATAEIARAKRYHRPFSLAYIDLDNFKSLNDQSGHAEGDRLLRTFADEMARHVRKNDVVARLGGDEFGILLPETAESAARAVIDKVSRRLAAISKRRRWGVTLSVGAVTFLRPPKTPIKAISMADRTMYEVKASGKKGVKLVSAF